MQSIIFNIILIISFFSKGIDKDEIITDYNNSNTVITAKLIDIRKVGNMGLFCEFEAVQIYKGKVHKTYLVKVQNNNFKKGTKLLLYLNKNTNKKYTIYKAKTKENSEFVNDEIKFLYSYVESKPFKHVKTPSEVKYVGGGSWL